MIIIDTETTGTDWRKHSLVSIGAIDSDNPENRFYEECRIFDGAKVEPEALALNGFTEGSIRNKALKTDREAVESFIAWTATVKDTTFAGENPSFDRDFLRAAAERYDLPWSFAFRTIDLHSVATAHMLARGLEIPSKNRHSDLNVDRIAQYVGLPARKGAHNALEDALIEAEALSRLVYGKGLIDSFKKYPLPASFKNK